MTDKLIFIIYEIVLWLIALVRLPTLFYLYLTGQKYQSSLLYRLGFKSVFIEKKTAPLIWFHAVSVGETKALAPLAKEIKNIFPACQIVVSSITETGHAEAKRCLKEADDYLYLPFDFYFLMRRLIRQTRPDIVIVCESDVWYHFLRLAKKQGALIALVNAKLSERSARRLQKIPFFTHRLFNLFDVICVQNQLYQQRFNLAAPYCSQLCVTGNLKLNESYSYLTTKELQVWREQLGIKSGELVLTIGSTHDPEERFLIYMLKKLWQDIPNLKVILVPRHPERFQDVKNLLQQENIPSISFTQLHFQTGSEKVVLIDVMGILRMCYQLADIALVGGSYTTLVGGHNILEPCWYGKPVIFGPYMYNQIEFVQMIQQYQAGLQVDLDHLFSVLKQLLENSQDRQTMGEKGQALIADATTATAQTLQALYPHLQQRMTRRP